MKTTIASALIVFSAALTGCQVSSTGGGVTSDESFRLSAPAAVDVKQGEVQTVTLSLHRGEHFKRDVTVEVRPSKGLTADPAYAVIRASEKADMQIRVGAAKDAAIGSYTVFVKGTPASGDPTSIEIKVKVAAP